MSKKVLNPEKFCIQHSKPRQHRNKGYEVIEPSGQKLHARVQFEIISTSDAMFRQEFAPHTGARAFPPLFPPASVKSSRQKSASSGVGSDHLSYFMCRARARAGH